MARRKNEPADRTPSLLRIIWSVVALGATMTPLIVSRSGREAFRVEKEVVYEAEAIVLGALLLIALVWHGRRFFEPLSRQRPVLIVAACAVAWTAITTLTSTNRTLSWPSLVWVASCAVVFIATLLVARIAPGILLGAVLVGAVFNAVIAVLQRQNIYNPFAFQPGLTLRLRVTAMVGNPNDTGTYLMFSLVVAVALLLVLRGARAAVVAVATAVIATGLLATETLTAIVATAAALLVLFIVAGRRRRALALLIAAGALAGSILFAPVRARYVSVYQLARSGNFFEASSSRLPAFIACWRMFREHPVTGVGPGCFAWWYMPHKAQLNRENPEMLRLPENFGQAHNDHLQILATTGAPGYAIFVAGLGILALRGRKTSGEHWASRFARLAAPSLAAASAVVTLAQFPLELAATTSVALHFFAICCAWTAE